MKLGRQIRGIARRRAERRAPRPSSPTPIFVSPRVAALLVILCILALTFVLYASPTTLIVALGGAALSMVLSFPVRALSHVMPRPLAILVTFLTLIGMFALAGIIIVPLLIDQLSALISRTPDIATGAEQFLLDLLKPLEKRNLLRGANSQQVVNKLVDELFARVQALTETILSGLVGYISSAFNFGVGLFGVLFVAAYLLVDVRKVKAAYLRMIPVHYRHDGRDLWNAFEASLSRYLGGLIFVVIIQGALSSLGLWLLGVPYALLLGAWVSVTAIIPYLGAFLGGIPAVIVALTFGSSTFDSALTSALLVVVIYVVIQQVESNLLTPRIQGQALHMHPILVFLGVIVGGQIGGILGVIFAVPALAVLRVLFDFLRVRIRTKSD
jgi:predicted PurR-regulated permease PerM